ncbi:MAG: MBL fold metallo-hydrolase [Bryobacterales bacterium]|nr:MBL fold metallo-hydrolase [Bryobacteraceae bacterium]MDW8354566.1 MBL fold metallo-hydrolase [Bryobacterales bacterium]
MARIVPLGTNGYFPSHGRHTMSFLVLGPEQALLLDAGTGVSRLLEPQIQELLRPYSMLNVVVSHYHLDHVVGLAYLPAVWARGGLRIYAPAPPLVDAEPEDALDRLLAPPLFPSSWRSFGVAIEALREERSRVAAWEAHLWRQAHPGGSVGMRLGDDLAYLTDTVADPSLASRLRGVRLLLHEVWTYDDTAGEAAAKGHSDFSAVAELVRCSQISAVMLVHHPPSRSPEEAETLAAAMARQTRVRVLPGIEGQVYEF